MKITRKDVVRKIVDYLQHCVLFSDRNSKSEERSQFTYIKNSGISLSRGAEICGVDIEDFKDILKERGIKIEVPRIPSDEVDKEVEIILNISAGIAMCSVPASAPLR